MLCLVELLTQQFKTGDFSARERQGFLQLSVSCIAQWCNVSSEMRKVEENITRPREFALQVGGSRFNMDDRNSRLFRSPMVIISRCLMR